MQNAFHAARQLEIELNRQQQDVPSGLGVETSNIFRLNQMNRLSPYASLKSERLDGIKTAIESLVMEQKLTPQELIKGMRKLDPTSQRTLQNSLGSTFGPNITAEKLAAAFYISEVLDREQKTPAQIAKDYLDSNGIKYVKNDPNNFVGSKPAVFDEITIPLSRHNTEDLSYAASGVEKLSDFFGRTIADSKYLKGTKVSFANSPEEFADRFFSLHPDQVGKISPEEIMSGTVGFNVESGDASGQRKLVLNFEALKSKRQTSYFGGNAMEETVAHEYAHSIEKSMSPNWGQDNDPATEEYRSIFESDPDVSPYSSKNISEHFAESFAKYVVSDQATPEFIEYLKKRGIEKPDVSKMLHPMMRDDVKQKLNALVNASEESPVIFKVGLSSPSNSEQDILNSIRVRGASNADLSNRRSMSIELIPKDPSMLPPGETNVGSGRGSLTVDSQGKLQVSGDLLSFADNTQGQGLGAGFLKEISKFIAMNGGGRITMNAGLSNGRYMWAISGFKFDRLSDVRDYVDLARSVLPFFETWRKNQGKLNGLTEDQKYGFYISLADAVKYNRLQKIEEISDPDLKAIAMQMYTGNGRFSTRDKSLEFMKAGLENNWDLSEEDYQTLIALASSTPSLDIMPIQFANIGRKGKADTAIDFDRRTKKRSSSFGRIFMLAREAMWSGYLDIPDARRGAN